MSAKAVVTARGCGLSSLTWSKVQCALKGCDPQVSGPDAISRLDVCINDIKSLEGLAEYTALQSLAVAQNKVLNLTQVDIVGLKRLNVSGNRLSSLSGIEAFPCLEWLDASSNALEAIGFLSACIQLQYLRLSNNGIHTLAGLEDLPELESLLLDGNLVQSLLQLRPLSVLPKLQLLAVAGNPMAMKASPQRLKVQLRNILPGLRVLDGEEVGARQGYSSARVHRWLESQASEGDAEPWQVQEGVQTQTAEAEPSKLRIVTVTMLPSPEMRLAGSYDRTGREARSSPKARSASVRKPQAPDIGLPSAPKQRLAEEALLNEDGGPIISTGAFQKLKRIESGSSVDRARRQSRVSIGYDVDGDPISGGLGGQGNLGVNQAGPFRALQRIQSGSSVERASRRQSRSRSPHRDMKRDSLSGKQRSCSRSRSPGYDSTGKPRSGIIKDGAFRNLRKIESGSSVDRAHRVSRLSQSSHWSSSEDDSDAPPLGSFRNLRRIESGSSVEGKLGSLSNDEAKRVRAFIAAGTASFGSSRGDAGSGTEGRSQRRSVTFRRQTNEIPGYDCDDASSRRRSSVTFQDLPDFIPSSSALSPEHSQHRPSVGFYPIPEVIEPGSEDSDSYTSAQEDNAHNDPPRRLRTSVTFVPDPEFIPVPLEVLRRESRERGARQDSAFGSGLAIPVEGQPVLPPPGSREPLSVRVAPRIPSLRSTDAAERPMGTLDHLDGSGESLHEDAPAEFRPGTPYAPRLSQQLISSSSLRCRTPRSVDNQTESDCSDPEEPQDSQCQNNVGPCLAALQAMLSAPSSLPSTIVQEAHAASQQDLALFASGIQGIESSQHPESEGGLLHTLPRLLAAGPYTFSLERQIVAQLSRCSSPRLGKTATMASGGSLKRLVAEQLLIGSTPDVADSAETPLDKPEGQQRDSSAASSRREASEVVDSASLQQVAMQLINGTASDVVENGDIGSARLEPMAAQAEDSTAAVRGWMLESGRLSFQAVQLLPQGVAMAETVWALESGKLSISEKPNLSTDAAVCKAKEDPVEALGDVSSVPRTISDSPQGRYERVADAVLYIEPEAQVPQTMSDVPEDLILQEESEQGEELQSTSPRRIVHIDTGSSFAGISTPSPRCSRNASWGSVDAPEANLQGLGVELTQLVPAYEAVEIIETKESGQLTRRTLSRMPSTIIEEGLGTAAAHPQAADALDAQP